MKINRNTPVSELMHSADKHLTAKEAYVIFSTARRDLTVRSCCEYDSCYVFQAVPHKFAKSEDADAMFDSLYFVNKNTRKCGMFKPFDISIDEYKRGKHVSNFK